MAKEKIFISSVQMEFADARKALYDYIYADPLLGKFFEPFIFEELPAIDQSVDKVYLREVASSNIYLGLFGEKYGFENSDGVSPTELEFDYASANHLTRFIFISNCPDNKRNIKEKALIKKAENILVRRKISSINELKTSVYSALVRYLEEKGIIRSGPFDASIIEKAVLHDINPEKVKWFVRLARAKRGFPLHESDSIEKILTHLNLLENNIPVNAALLLFGKQPQRFFVSSEVRCVVFRGTKMEKPIPSYQVFKGTVFDLADKTIEFVLSKLDYRVGTREIDVQAPGAYEIPKDVISEAVVNAIVHRDYTSNASVQIMLFSDRLEIWNPGSLPLGWTTEKLKQIHNSVPANPLMAEPMYLTAYIERLGTGTSDMITKSLEVGIAEPEFIQETEFRTILFRPVSINITPEDTPEDTPEVTPEVIRLVQVVDGAMSRKDLQQKLGLKDEKYFRENYQQKAIKFGVLEMTIPDKPNSRNQKYRLTQKGVVLKQTLKA